MYLKHLSLTNFRNFARLDVDLPRRVVVLVGRNAQGKTNALEAIYLLATLKPMRARRGRELVRWGAEEAQVACLADSSGLQRRYKVTLGERRYDICSNWHLGGNRIASGDTRARIGAPWPCTVPTYRAAAASKPPHRAPLRRSHRRTRLRGG